MAQREVKVSKRTKEQIEVDERLRDATISKLTKVMSQRWPQLRDADGPVTIMLTIAATVAISISFTQRVEIEAEATDEGPMLPMTSTTSNGSEPTAPPRGVKPKWKVGDPVETLDGDGEVESVSWDSERKTFNYVVSKINGVATLEFLETALKDYKPASV